MNVIGNSQQMNPHHQYNGHQMSPPASGQYEYSIEGQPEQLRTQGGSVPAQIAPQAQQIKQGGTIGSKSSNQGNSMPKRAPHSELTSYQSEKRLKEYKQQQA